MSISTVAIIGAGSKKGQDYYQELQRRNDVEVVACVVNRTLPDCLKGFKGEIIYRGDIDALLKGKKIQAAVITLPHHEHQKVTMKLLDAGVYVIKEKPLSLTTEDLKSIESIIKDKSLSPVFTTVQRSVHPSFLSAKEHLHEVGQIKSFDYQYFFALPSMTSGWRADKEKSGGGVLMDMGYHIIDIIHLFFGKPTNVKSQFDYFYDEMRHRQLEDVATISMDYGSFSGEIALNRHAEEKKEEFIVKGEKGVITINAEGYSIEDESGIRKFPILLSKKDLISKMFDYCLDLSRNREALNLDFQRNIENVTLINTIYQNIGDTK